MKPYHCIESTIEIKVNEHIIRLWINQNDIPVSYNKEIEYLEKIQTFSDLTWEKIIEEVIKLVPDLNAIQIKSSTRQGGEIGLVVYTVPFEDVRG